MTSKLETFLAGQRWVPDNPKDRPPCDWSDATTTNRLCDIIEQLAKLVLWYSLCEDGGKDGVLETQQRIDAILLACLKDQL